jgi:hypothetical protein
MLMFSQWCIGAKHLGRKESKGNAVTTPGEYRSREERERMESRRDAIHLAGGLVATAIVLAIIVVAIAVAQ